MQKTLVTGWSWDFSLRLCSLASGRLGTRSLPSIALVQPIEAPVLGFHTSSGRTRALAPPSPPRSRSGSAPFPEQLDDDEVTADEQGRDVSGHDHPVHAQWIIEHAEPQGLDDRVRGVKQPDHDEDPHEPDRAAPLGPEREQRNQ